MKMSRIDDKIHKNGKLWRFQMTRHYQVSDQVAMHDIAEWIDKFDLPFHKISSELVWFLDHLKKLFKCRFAPIMQTGISSKLWMILDGHSKGQGPFSNWLIWWVYDDQRPWRNVKHFGPFGDKKEQEMKKLRDKFQKMFKKSGMTAFEFLGLLKEAYEEKKEWAMNKVKSLECRLAALIREIGQIKAKKIAEKVGKDLAWFVAGAISHELAEIAIKAIAKESLEVAAKQGAKSAAKQGAKQGGKAAAKV